MEFIHQHRKKYSNKAYLKEMEIERKNTNKKILYIKRIKTVYNLNIKFVTNNVFTLLDKSNKISFVNKFISENLIE